MNTILVIDDEESIRRLIKDSLSMNFYIYTAESGTDALTKINAGIDIIILDVNMPDMTGFELCEKIREHISCPIIFLSARIEEHDRIRGLEIGGDDYVTKPFSVIELQARIDAHLRREHRKKKWDVKFNGNLRIDYLQKSVSINNKKIEMPKKEYEIIEFLSMNEGIVFDKDTIYEKVWGIDACGYSNSVKEHIRKIRNRFAELDEKDHIITVWGIGYKWIF